MKKEKSYYTIYLMPNGRYCYELSVEGGKPFTVSGEDAAGVRGFKSYFAAEHDAKCTGAISRNALNKSITRN